MITKETTYGLLLSDIEKINGVFKRYPEIETAIIYGSRAIGTHRNGSDIDLTLKGDISTQLLFAIENALDNLMLPYKIDLSVIDTISNPDLVEHIHRVGKVFYQS